MNGDAFLQFVQSTFLLEGDGVLCFEVTDTIERLTKHVATVRAGGAGTPETRKVAREIIAAERPHVPQNIQDNDVNMLIGEQLAKVEPSFKYFEDRVKDLKPQLDIFGACQLFDPTRVGSHQQLALNDVERQLKLFPFFSALTAQVLLATWNAYLVYSGGHPVAFFNGVARYMNSGGWPLGRPGSRYGSKLHAQ